MALVHKLSFSVPEELCKRFKGLTFDVGTTLIKFAYRNKSDEAITNTDNKHSDSRLSCLEFVTFSVSDMAEAFEYVRQRADIRRNGDEPVTLYATGVGSATYEKQIFQTLGVNKITIVTEVDCNVESFVYLARHLSRSEFLEPFIADAAVDAVTQLTAYKTTVESWKTLGMCAGQTAEGKQFREIARLVTERCESGGTDVVDGCSVERTLVQELPDMFPCLLVNYGSATVCMEIAEDGSYHLVDICTRSSLSFLCLAKLLVNSDSFDEVIELASKGDIRKIDKYTDQCGTKDGSQDAYSSWLNDVSVPTISFGHVINADRGDLKREDLAIALLKYVVSDMVERTHFVCHSRALKRVFFCSSFCNNPFVRRIITAEFVYRMLTRSILIEDEFYADFDFIRPGAYLGVLGSAVRDLED